MNRRMFLGKIHRVVVTDANLDYEGSVTVDQDLMDAAGMLPHEEVHVWNVTRGSRLTTYLVPGARGSGTVCLNGAAAHLNQPGDVAILACFGDMSEDQARQHQPKVVFVDAQNRISRIGDEHAGPRRPLHNAPAGVAE